MTKQEIIMELMHITHGVTENMISENTAVEMVNQLLDKATRNNDDEETIITYFSPFTNLPVLVETNTHQYLLNVINTIIKGE